MKKIYLALFAIILLGGCSFSGGDKSKSTQLPKETVRYYLSVPSDGKYFNKQVVPAGSYVLSCGDFLTIQDFGTVTYQNKAQLLEFVLASLLSYSPQEKSIYANPLKEMGIRLESVEENQGKITVKVQGEFKDIGLCTNASAKMMLERTVKEYTSDYEILLNESDEEWRCLYESGCIK